MLKDIVQTLGMKLIPMPGDGNCFFCSIAYIVLIKSQRDNITQFCPTYFQETTLSDVQNLQATSKELRKLMVEERRSHSDEYASFVIGIDVLRGRKVSQ